MSGARSGVDNRDRMEGMDHDSSDTLAAEPRRKGGLMQSGNVSTLSISIVLADHQVHAFKSGVARPSLLGLDKLAAEKRAQAAASGSSSGPPSKRVKVEDDDVDGVNTSGGVFKGGFNLHKVDSLFFSPGHSCQTRGCPSQAR